MVADPAATTNRPVLHVPGRARRRGRPARRPGAAVADDERHDGGVGRRPGRHRHPPRPAGGTPAAGCASAPTASCTSAPATPRSAPTRRTSRRWAARCCGWAGTAPSLPTTRSSRRGGNARLRVHLRPPQRPGPRPAPGDQRAVVGRARHRPRRRGEPPRARRELRLGPGARATTSRGPMTDLAKFPSARPRDVELGVPDRRDQRRHVPHRPPMGGLARCARRRPAQGPGGDADADEPDARAEPRGRDDARCRRPRASAASAPWRRAPTARSGSRRRTAATTASSGSRPPRPCPVRAAGHAHPARRASPSCAPGPRSPSSSAAPTTGSTCGAAPTTAASWAGYTSADITSTNAPSAASSAPGRVDLVTRRSSGAVVQSWFRGGRRLGSTQLGGRRPRAARGLPGRRHARRVRRGARPASAFRQHWDRQRLERLGLDRRQVHLGAVGVGRPSHGASSSSAGGAPTAPPTSASSRRPPAWTRWRGEG